ncbi:MAG: Uma2 family endonuclease [Chloroflexota bacterium]
MSVLELTPPVKKKRIIYPDSDGKPMADNTKQFRYITTIQGNLALLYENDPNVVVFGDLLWYPVEGNPYLFIFYERYGVEEYYLYDPDRGRLQGWWRRQGRLRPVASMNGWRSPRLGIRFEMKGKELELFSPDGSRFLTYVELGQARQVAEARAQYAESRAQHAESRAEAEAQARQEAEARLRELEAKLQEVGLL